MKQIYFLILITCIGNFAYPQDTNIVRFRACSQCSNTWLDNAPNQDFTYDAAAEYPANLIADDYGPRQNGADIYDWHGGIDYNSAAGNADMGDLILALESGRIGGSLGAGYKRLIVNGTHDLGYGHFFTSDSNPNSGWPYLPLQSGGCRLINMSSPNGSQRCIIRVVAGDTTAIGPVGGNVIFNGKIFVVRDSITAGEPIGPTGFSGLSNGAHLHLFSNPDGSTGTHDTITKDPLQYVQYTAPDYDIQIRKVLNYGSNNTQTWAAPSYPGTNASPIVVRPVMLNEGANLNRYNTVNDINHVELMVRRLPNDDFQLIQGAGHWSEILIGARIGENMMPSYMYQDGSGSNGGGPPQIGSLSRQGIRPFAYATNGAHPYDDFYFPDFITRIHADDPMDGGTALFTNCPGHARYNDGRYEIKAVATDVRGNAHESEAVAFTLDNFQPYIASFTFNANSVAQYTRKWSCSSCGISLSANPFMEINQSSWNNWLLNPSLIVNASASEPLDNLTMDIVIEGSVLQEDIPGLALPNGIDWKFDISQYAAQLSGKVAFIFYGHDMNGNSLLAFSPAQQSSCVTVPTRTGASSWNNPGNISTGPDNIHAVCIDCGGRSPDGDCAVIALVPDETITITPLTPCLCEGQPQQAFEVQADGSAGPFIFSWAGPEGYTSDEQNPADMEVAGVYTLFITNAYGCTFSYDVGITACPLPTLQPTIHPACPDDSGGAIGLAISGGAPPFSFLWSNGADSQNLANLEPGQYTVTVSGANGCSLEQSFTVPASGEIPFSIQASASPPGCAGGSDGSIALLISPPDGNYTISWSTGATGNPLAGLSAGLYAATVTNSDGCLVEALSVSLTEPSPLQAFATPYSATCPQSADGQVVLSVSGGVNPYNFLWSNGATGQELMGVPPGTYSATVTDANGCTVQASATVAAGSGITLEAAVTPAACANGPDGAISLIVSGGSGQGLAYAWSAPGNPGFQFSGASPSGLAPGLYCATVTDNAGCSESGCWEVEAGEEWPYIERVRVYASPGLLDCVVMPALQADCSWQPAPLIASSGSNGQDLTHLLKKQCLSVSFTLSPDDGAIGIGAITGGQPPYYVNWLNLNPGAVISEGGYLVEGLESGMEYCVRIVDGNGCSSEECVFLCKSLEGSYDIVAEEPCIYRRNGS